jgi:hypothetical protein
MGVPFAEYLGPLWDALGGRRGIDGAAIPATAFVAADHGARDLSFCPVYEAEELVLLGARTVDPELLLDMRDDGRLVAGRGGCRRGRLRRERDAAGRTQGQDD